MIDTAELNDLNAQQLRDVVQSLLGTLATQTAEIKFKQALIDKLTHEMAVLKRLKFAAKSESFNAEQRSLLDEAIDADLEALAREIEQLAPPPQSKAAKEQPKRQPLPASLPRREIRHEPERTTCSCGCQLKRIGEDVAEKLDYVPGVFTVERHVRVRAHHARFAYRQRPSSLLWRVGIHDDISRPAQCSLTLRPV